MNANLSTYHFIVYYSFNFMCHSLLSCQTGFLFKYTDMAFFKNYNKKCKMYEKVTIIKSDIVKEEYGP